jgi:hypothetical protein
LVDFTGSTVGRWTVIQMLVPGKPHRGRRWLARCECGTEKVMSTADITQCVTFECVKCAGARRVGLPKGSYTRPT